MALALVSWCPWGEVPLGGYLPPLPEYTYLFEAGALSKPLHHLAQLGQSLFPALLLLPADSSVCASIIQSLLLQWGKQTRKSDGIDKMRYNLNTKK